MNLLIDFIDETEEVKEEYMSLIREVLEKQLKWKISRMVRRYR